MAATARRQLTRAMSMAVKAAALGADRVARPPAGITFLIYHRVGAGTGSLIDLPDATFDEQLAELTMIARPLSIDEAVAELQGHALSTDPRPAVVVTFDDGTGDFADHALPLLVRHRVPAVLYVATAFVDENRRWPDGCPPLSWAALRDVAGSGVVTVGSHTHNHCLLDRSDRATVVTELDRSIDLLGEHLGVQATHFAYPKALAAVGPNEAEVRRRFATATVAGNRANVPGRSDLHRLARTAVQTTDVGPFFRQKLRGGLRLESSARDAVNRLRYREAMA
jgi:peptidoglycan/xylan/chitin deacetylase (PgdA/CDA1 family)